MIKKFGDKKITIRKLSNKDLNQPEKFQDFINSLIDEDAMIYMNTKKSKKEEIEWLKGKLNNIKKKKAVCLIAECDGVVVGNTDITLEGERMSHIGEFGISVRRGCRGIGLGQFLMKEVMELAKKELKPQLKVLKLGVFPGNRPALRLYQKMGFRQVAEIPKKLQFQGRLISEIIMIKEL